jgi:hypothetical protein
MVNNNLQQTLKTVLISSVVSAGVIIWNELLGAPFLLAIVLVSIIVVLTSKTENA